MNRMKTLTKLAVPLMLVVIVSACVNEPRRVTVTGKPNLDLPIKLSEEGWAALERTGDTDAIDTVNAQWFCAYERDDLTPEEINEFCEDQPKEGTTE